MPGQGSGVRASGVAGLLWEPRAQFMGCEHGVCMCGVCVAGSPRLGEASKPCICYAGGAVGGLAALDMVGCIQGRVSVTTHRPWDVWGKQLCRHIHTRSIGQRDRIFCCLINFIKQWS